MIDVVSLAGCFASIEFERSQGGMKAVHGEVKLHDGVHSMEWRIFRLDTAKWREFMAVLDKPPKELPRLKRLLNEPGYFNTDSQAS